MALSGPRLSYVRAEEKSGGEEAVERALELAREIEALLEDTRSVAAPAVDERTHSTRMARAIAASLVDELGVLARDGQHRVA